MILVIAEQRGGTLHRASWETIAAAQQIGAGAPIVVALPAAPGMPAGAASELAAAAVQEDVDAVGLSILSGAHNSLLPEITRLLKEQGADDILVFAGGIIPDQDIQGLKTAGIDEVFLPGTSTRDIVQYLQDRLAAA